MSNKIFALLCLMCAVTAIPVPEDQLKSIELLKIPLKGDKELDVLTLGDQGSQKERNKRTIGVLRELFPELSKVIAINEEEQSQGDADAAASQIDLIRVVRETAASENSIDTKATTDNSDQKTAESKSPAIDDLSLDSAEDDEKNHDKRFLDFGGAKDSSSSGGSGNFLFDIIRLVSGSSGTEKTDEEENAPTDDEDQEEGKGDGYTEGIPGPVTRLFVLANRGLSNLIQDLILRIAQTSERLVNFKARLITSLI